MALMSAFPATLAGNRAVLTSVIVAAPPALMVWQLTMASKGNGLVPCRLASGPLPGSGDLIPERLERVDVDLREGAARLAAHQGTGPGPHGRDGAARSATVIPVPTAAGTHARFVDQMIHKEKKKKKE